MRHRMYILVLVDVLVLVDILVLVVPGITYIHDLYIHTLN